jgi:long-chain acyl-CoA synthetase
MDFTRLFDILEYQQMRYPRKDAFATRVNGQWNPISTEKAIHERNCWSAGLLQAGLHKGQHIGVMAHCGSTQWMIADAAMMQIGIVPVPIHATARPDEIAHIIRDAALAAVFVSNADMLAKFRAAGPFSGKIIAFEPTEGALHCSELVCEPDDHDLQKIAYFRDLIQPGDLATILYTSGSTGQPKGVMLSHHNIVSNIKSVLAIVPVNSAMTALSFLPLSHILERTVCYLYQASGTGIWFAESIENLPQTLREVRPHFFTAVPRILERSYERLKEIRDNSGFLQKKLIHWALTLGERYPFSGGEAMPLLYRLQLMAARWLVFGKFKRLMGGRLKGIAVGAAALQPKLGRLFSAMGVDVREGYGLTETSPVVAFNRFEPGGVHFGTVGIPAPGVEVRIADANEQGEGEIQVRGHNVMLGYLNLPAETREKFTPDGWLRTGDLGRFEHKRFLKITGRISEIFKTTSGKFVAPAFVEEQLRTSPFIEHALVYGLNQPAANAVIVPDFAYLERWCKEHKIHWTSPEFMLHNPKIEKRFREEMNTINETLLGQAEQIRHFRLVADAWTAENGLLTPSLKLRRNLLMEKYAN